jgi:TusA-related sulfurtransferase
MVEIDLTGYECPMPVVKAMKVIEKNPGMAISLLLDKESACDDIARMAQKRGYTSRAEKMDGHFRIILAPKNRVTD